MEKAKVSVIQLFSLMFIFNMGTALVVGYGIEAGKDAWLAILLGTCGGSFYFLFTIYYFANIQISRLQGWLKKYWVNTLVGSLDYYILCIFCIYQREICVILGSCYFHQL